MCPKCPGQYLTQATSSREVWAGKSRRAGSKDPSFQAQPDMSSAGAISHFAFCTLLLLRRPPPLMKYSLPRHPNSSCPKPSLLSTVTKSGCFVQIPIHSEYHPQGQPPRAIHIAPRAWPGPCPACSPVHLKGSNVCRVGGGGLLSPRSKLPHSGTSLVVKWLGLSSFPAVARVQSLVGELRSYKPLPHSLQESGVRGACAPILPPHPCLNRANYSQSLSFLISKVRIAPTV